MIPALLLAAALSPPATPSGHELTAAVGLGTRAPIFVVSWTGRRRWGAWLRLDQPDGKPAGREAYPNSTQVYTTAGSMGVAWRALPRLAVGIGYGEKKEDITVYGSSATEPSAPVLEDRDEDEHGLAAIGTWTFPVNDKLGVAVSASGGPSGFGAAAGVTFFVP